MLNFKKHIYYVKNTKILKFAIMLKLFKFNKFDNVKLLIIIYLKLLNNIVIIILTKTKYVK